MVSNIHEYTVSEFSNSIKRMVEDNFGYVRIKGEISGFKKATSGHVYFNLKDELSVINAVCFRQVASLINFDVEDGLEVVALGMVTTYSGRSNYQIIVEKLEIAGIGVIMAAIEKRRLRFLQEGYFDKKYKKSLPFLPKIIAVITSPTGAVIEDIINRITSRFPTHLLIYPATMQGKNSASEVRNGVRYFNQSDKKPDVIIIARGGGSFEDLLPFNDEDLVKEVFESKIPIISAIGHETDTTLIDYVADLRAPTPSAAAELVVPVLRDLQILNNNLGKRLISYCVNLFAIKQKDFISLSANLLRLPQGLMISEQKLINLSTKLSYPKEKLINLEQKLRHIISVIKNNLKHSLENKEQNFKLFGNQIIKFDQINQSYSKRENKLLFLANNLQNSHQIFFKDSKNRIEQLNKLLDSYDYKNVLARGYAVVKYKGKVVRNKEKVCNNQIINIEVMDGNFDAVVYDTNFSDRKSLPKKNNVDNMPLLSLFDKII